MNKKEWMRREIAGWRNENLIDDALTQTLLARYAETVSSVSIGAVFAGAFGALLIGMGLIALFAINWPNLGRGTRAFISILPLLICGALALWAVWKNWKSRLFWEPLGIFWSIAVVSAACLVAQTYNIGGSMSNFILLIAFLTLPVVLITGAFVPMVGWPLFALIWGNSVLDTYGRSWSLMFSALGLLLLSLPAFVLFFRQKHNQFVRSTGEVFTGLICSVETATIIALFRPQLLSYSWRISATICIFWLFSAIVRWSGIFFKIRKWPIVATIVTAITAGAAVFQGVWMYLAAIVVAITIAVWGIRRMKLSFMNIGAVLLLWLILVKFFSCNVDFTVKSLVAIFSGVMLLVLNSSIMSFKKWRVKK